MSFITKIYTKYHSAYIRKFYKSIVAVLSFKSSIIAIMSLHYVLNVLDNGFSVSKSSNKTVVDIASNRFSYKMKAYAEETGSPYCSAVFLVQR